MSQVIEYITHIYEYIIIAIDVLNRYYYIVILKTHILYTSVIYDDSASTIRPLKKLLLDRQLRDYQPFGMYASY